MSDQTPTYVFDDDDKVYAYVDGKVVASSTDLEELEAKLAEAKDDEPDTDKEAPKRRQSDDPDYDEAEQQEAEKTATHVTTPNGIKGQIMGKKSGLWGDQMTIRLENGRIAKFDVTGRESYSTEKTAHVSPSKGFEAKLAETVDGTRDSLIARIKTLKEIKAEASAMVKGSSYSEAIRLDNIVVTADMELREVTDALAAQDDTESFIPTAPFQSEVVEQESLGGGDSSWLDHTVGEMIGEAEAQDFDKLMDEGPDEFVAELETPALADAGVVRDMATNMVASKTAGIEAQAANEFRTEFLERVEEARRTALSARKSVQAKTAKAEEDNFDGPSEGLFW